MTTPTPSKRPRFAIEVTLVDGVKKFLSPTGRNTDYYTYDTHEEAEKVMRMCYPEPKDSDGVRVVEV